VLGDQAKSEEEPEKSEFDEVPRTSEPDKVPDEPESDEVSIKSEPDQVFVKSVLSGILGTSKDWTEYELELRVTYEEFRNYDSAVDLVRRGPSMP